MNLPYRVLFFAVLLGSAACGSSAPGSTSPDDTSDQDPSEHDTTDSDPSSNAAPVFTAQPADQTVSAGTAATFSTTVTGSPAPALQWERSTDDGATWSAITDATDTTYTTALVDVLDSGTRFHLVATNGSGSATSDAATLLVYTGDGIAPAFTSQPQDVTVDNGAVAQFSVAVSGMPTPTIQWQEFALATASWRDIAGATSTTYTTPPVSDGFSSPLYRAVATNIAGSATSNSAAITIPPATAPVVNIHDAPMYTVAGNNVRFEATVEGHPTPALQWQESTDLSTWTDIVGAVTNVLEIAGVQTSQNLHTYRLVATNPAGTAFTMSRLIVCESAPLTVVHNPAWWQYMQESNTSGGLFCPSVGPTLIHAYNNDPSVIEVYGYLETGMSCLQEELSFRYDIPTQKVVRVDYSGVAANGNSFHAFCLPGSDVYLSCDQVTIDWQGGVINFVDAKFGAVGQNNDITLNGSLYFPPQ